MELASEELGRREKSKWHVLHHMALSIIIFLKTKEHLHFKVQWIESPAKVCETEGQPSSLWRY